MLRFFVDMDQRKEIGREDSDVALFFELMYEGELVLKLSALGLVAAINDDLDRNRYRQLHRLVRSDGIGEWATVIQDVLTGPAAQSLDDEARKEQRQLTEQLGGDTWQHQAIQAISDVLTDLEITQAPLGTRVKGWTWFEQFGRLRNETRAHGAYRPGRLSLACVKLEQSINILKSNFSLFNRPWAYLHRNLSGKYKVIPLCGPQSLFDPFRSSWERNDADGIYIGFSRPRRVELAETDTDAADLLLPNGAFTDSSYELMSYLTGSKRRGDSRPFLAPATSLPLSETNGIDELDVRGNCHTNMPPAPDDYVRRASIEEELRAVLVDDRHPMVTLSGRGGIGKTWLTLHVLSEIATSRRFDVVLWFSARDIDLLPQGPKLVKPAVLTRRDVARQVVRLIQPAEAEAKGFKPEDYLSRALSSQDLGPTLFVFDNFETMRDPVDVFKWLDTYVRTPNKILITTRVRDFRGDYPVDVPGMADAEAHELITQTVASLGIAHLVNDEYRESLVRESAGHPYVIKVLLGEVGRSGVAGSVQRLTASQDRILEALFERTWAGLSPAARRCLLTLSSWRSAIPRVALEAVLLRPTNDRMDVDEAIEELRRFSFIETSVSPEDQKEFIWLPLVTFEFGRKKLATSAERDAIQSDVEMLQRFGASRNSAIPKSLEVPLRRFVTDVAEKSAGNASTLEAYRTILEFIAGSYTPAWLLLSNLYEELQYPEASQDAIDAAKRFVEDASQKEDSAAAYPGWIRLAQLHRRGGDRLQELLALVEAGVCSDSMNQISDAANRVNSLLSDYLPDSDDKRLLVRRLSVEMERRLSDATATDCSRLAWLYLHMGQDVDARRLTSLGLRLEGNNQYCQALATRLGMLNV
ncbi:MAG: NB-ARC domain-containing protein [Dehalococcoidia bacterium]